MFTKGASANAIQAQFDELTARLRSEQPYKAIKVGEDLLPLKPTDHLLAAIIMSYMIAKESQAVEDGVTGALVILNMAVNGSVLHKKSANGIIREALLRYQSELGLDWLKIEQDIMEKWTLVNALIQAADGIDLRQSS